MDTKKDFKIISCQPILAQAYKSLIIYKDKNNLTTQLNLKYRLNFY